MYNFTLVALAKQAFGHIDCHGQKIKLVLHIYCSPCKTTINSYNFFTQCVERIVNARATCCTGPQEHIIGEIKIILLKYCTCCLHINRKVFNLALWMRLHVLFFS